MSGLVTANNDISTALEAVNAKHYMTKLCNIWANGIDLVEKRAQFINTDERMSVKALVDPAIINEHLKGVELTAKIAKHIKEFISIGEQKEDIYDVMAKELNKQKNE